MTMNDSEVWNAEVWNPRTYGRDGHLRELFESFCDGNGEI